MKPRLLIAAAALVAWLSFATGFLLAQTHLATPVLQRDANGVVTITCATPDAVVRYSLDGSEPGPRTGAYLAPIELAQGGVVKARALSADRKETSNLAEAKYDPLPGAQRLPSTLVPVTQSRDWPKYDWEKRHAAVVALVRERKPQLVFIGDSITHFWGGEPQDARQAATDIWKKFYEARNAVNLGYGWDRTENVLWRLQHGELDPAVAGPKVIVMMIGTNNRDLNTPAEIAAGIRAICTELHTRSPQTKILLLGVFPRGEKQDAGRQKTTDLNNLIAQFDGHDNITYLDISPKFLNPDGTMSRDVMGDFLHPTAKGYAIWAEAMEPTLRKLLGEAAP